MTTIYNVTCKFNVNKKFSEDDLKKFFNIKLLNLIMSLEEAI